MLLSLESTKEVKAKDVKVIYNFKEQVEELALSLSQSTWTSIY